MKMQKERQRILRRAGMTESDTEKIDEAVSESERYTRGEIVVALTGESHSYAFWELFFALGCSAVLFACFVFFFDAVAAAFSFFFWGDLPERFMLIAGGTLIFFCTALLFFFANIPAVDRLIVPAAYRNEAVFRRAVRFFAESGVYDTKERSGILIFISLTERRVCIIADRGICTEIEQSVWDTLAADLASGFAKNNKTRRIKEGQREVSSSAAALVQTIKACGSLLAKHFPADKDNPDELRNSLIVLEGSE